MEDKKQEAAKRLETELLGKTKEQASVECKKHGVACRVMREDKTNYFGTQDLNFSRLNLEIDAGVITKIDIG